MTDQTRDFDEPVLRSALKRVYGGQAAPQDLRQRILQTLAEEPPVLRIPAWYRRPYVLAAAAAFILAMAGLYQKVLLQPLDNNFDDRSFLAMIDTHDRCSVENHFGSGIPRENFTRIGQTLSRELRKSVLAANLVGEGWEFRGAKVCPVGDKVGAHLMFARNQQRLSVFSVPGMGCGEEDGCINSQILRDHMIAGFTDHGAAYCMVAYCEQRRLSLNEVSTLLERHRRELVATVVPVNAVVAQHAVAR